MERIKCMVYCSTPEIDPETKEYRCVWRYGWIEGYDQSEETLRPIVRTADGHYYNSCDPKYVREVA